MREASNKKHTVSQSHALNSESELLAVSKLVKHALSIKIKQDTG